MGWLRTRQVELSPWYPGKGRASWKVEKWQKQPKQQSRKMEKGLHFQTSEALCHSRCLTIKVTRMKLQFNTLRSYWYARQETTAWQSKSYTPVKTVFTQTTNNIGRVTIMNAYHPSKGKHIYMKIVITNQLIKIKKMEMYVTEHP